MPQLVNAVSHPEYGNPQNPDLKDFLQQYSPSQIIKEPTKQSSQPLPQPSPEPPSEQPQPKPITPPQIEYDLPSEKGVDYKPLRDLLKAGKWKEADEETLTVMLKAAGKEQESYLNYDDFEKFPCTDLRTIDQLWVKYSNGRFGFSVQKRIWESVGEDYEKFGDRVGWRKGMLGTFINKEWLKLEDLTFSEAAPEGHLPAAAHLCGSFVVVGSSGRVVVVRRGEFFSRVQTCEV